MERSLEQLASRLDAEDAVVRMFVATDERDWPALESCFTDPFVLDMTSMTGGHPVKMTPRQVAEAWAEGFRTLDHVHHQVGNFRTTVNGSRAVVRCYGIAFHYRASIRADAKSRTFVGSYAFDLENDAGWRISRLQFNVKFIEGNLQLESST